MDKIFKNIGQNITHYRKLKGILQGELAEKIGLTPTTLSKIESGSTDIKLGTIYKISKVLDIDIEKIMFGSNVFLLNDKIIEILSKKNIDNLE